MIRAYLEHERYKTMDDLETTFDTLHGRSKPAETPTTVLENQLANAQASGSGSGGLPPPLGASEVPEEDALLNLAESGQAVPLTQAPSTSSSAASLPSSRKRKLANTEVNFSRVGDEANVLNHAFRQPEAIPELVPVPIERQTALPGRENDTEIRAGIVAELVRGGQWSGSRPAVINSLGSLIYRVLLLIQIHQNETIGANNEVVYWSDCVKHGGVSQAWNSRKASRQA